MCEREKSEREEESTMLYNPTFKLLTCRRLARFRRGRERNVERIRPRRPKNEHRVLMNVHGQVKKKSKLKRCGRVGEGGWGGLRRAGMTLK